MYLQLYYFWPHSILIIAFMLESKYNNEETDIKQFVYARKSIRFPWFILVSKGGGIYALVFSRMETCNWIRSTLISGWKFMPWFLSWLYKGKLPIICIE
jgi:hypothetical protein